MNQRFYNNLIYILLSYSSIQSACLQDSVNFFGKVSDTINKEAICGTLLIFTSTDDKRIETTSSKEGNFQVFLCDDEKYKIKIRYIGYDELVDSIYIPSNVNVMQKDFELQCDIISYPVPIIDEYETYHGKLASLKPEEILTIRIDSVAVELDLLLFYSTFKNNSTERIYILKADECFHPFIFTIKNSKNEYMQYNMGYLGCDVSPRLFFYMENLIVIEPLSEISYPPTWIFLYSFGNFPEDIYSIEVAYKFFPKENITVSSRFSYEEFLSKYSDPISANALALRGIYESQNQTYFDNKEAIQILKKLKNCIDE